MASEVVIRLRTTGAANAIAAVDQIDREFGNLERTLQGMSSRMQSVGMSLTAAVTLPLVALGGAAVKSAMDWETAMVGVAKTVDATEEELAALGDRFVEMSEVIPISSNDLAVLGAAAGQLGVELQNIGEFVDVMAALGVSTNIAAEDAAMSLARLMNIMGTSQTDVRRLGSTIVELGNNLATTEKEIVQMGLRIASVGKQVGLTEAQVLSFAAALSSVGIRAELGGSAIGRVMSTIANAVAQGGPVLSEISRVADMTDEVFSQRFEDDAAGAILAFIEGLKRVADEGENVFAVLERLSLADLRVRDALLAASKAGDLFRRSMELGSRGWEENIALTEEAKKFYARTAAEAQTLGHQLANVAAELGTALEPETRATIRALKGLLGGARSVVQVFAALPAPVRATVIVVAALAAATGPAILGMGLLTRASSILMFELPKLVVAIRALMGAAALGGLSSMLLPGGLLLVGLGLLIGLLVSAKLRAAEAAAEVARATEQMRIGYEGLDFEATARRLSAAHKAVTTAQARLNELRQQAAEQTVIYDTREGQIQRVPRELTLQIEAQEWLLERIGTNVLLLEEHFVALAAIQVPDVLDPDPAAEQVYQGLASALSASREFLLMLSEAEREASRTVEGLEMELAVFERTLAGLDPKTGPFIQMEEQVARLRAELEMTQIVLESLQDTMAEVLSARLQAEISARLPGAGLAGVGPGGFPLPGLLPPSVTAMEVSLRDQVQSLANAMREIGMSIEELATVAPDQFALLDLAARNAGVSVEALAASLGISHIETERAGQVVVASFSAMAQAAIRGSQQMAQSVISALTQIMQSLPGVGGLGGAIIGGLGGILGAIFSRRQAQPQPVRVTSYDDEARRQMADAQRGPDKVVLQFVSSSTGEMIEEIEYELRRRQAGDEVVRIPRGIFI